MLVALTSREVERLVLGRRARRLLHWDLPPGGVGFKVRPCVTRGLRPLAIRRRVWFPNDSPNLKHLRDVGLGRQVGRSPRHCPCVAENCVAVERRALLLSDRSQCNRDSRVHDLSSRRPVPLSF